MDFHYWYIKWSSFDLFHIDNVLSMSCISGCVDFHFIDFNNNQIINSSLGLLNQKTDPEPRTVKDLQFTDSNKTNDNLELVVKHEKEISTEASNGISYPTELEAVILCRQWNVTFKISEGMFCWFKTNETINGCSKCSVGLQRRRYQSCGRQCILRFSKEKTVGAALGGPVLIMLSNLSNCLTNIKADCGARANSAQLHTDCPCQLWSWPRTDVTGEDVDGNQQCVCGTDRSSIHLRKWMMSISRVSKYVHTAPGPGSMCTMTYRERSDGNKYAASPTARWN